MPDDPVDDLIGEIFAPPYRAGPPTTAHKSITPGLRRVLVDMHVQSSKEPVKFPTSHGAFPGDLLAVIPPVVPDANWLRNDIRYACGHDQRTVLVNAANAGLFRLFCAKHVIDEVAEHSGEWVTGSDVSQVAFLRRWVVEYLPLIRVLQDDNVSPDLLTPDETARLAELRRVDPDDVPSATLALALGAFYLTGDKPALRAVYGPHADLSGHDESLDTLKAGGDAGELGQMLQLTTGVVGALASVSVEGTRRLWRGLGPGGLLVAALLLFLGYKKVKPETKTKIRSAAAPALVAFAEAYGEYQAALASFRQAAPDIPTWGSMAETNPATAVLTRACLHTLARTGLSNCSAVELRSLLPALPVPHGAAKVRETLRGQPCFYEAWSGRWQVGDIAHPIQELLAQRPELGATG